MSNPYKRGRPFSADRNPPPKGEAGCYWWTDPEGVRQYHGDTKDLGQRLKQHQKSGEMVPGSRFFYMVARPESVTGERRAHEKVKIEKHKPVLNKRAGGGGPTGW